MDIPVFLPTSNYGYISCIKINGRPILPPLLDADRRLEMAHYRQLALSLEEKLIRLTTRQSSLMQSSSDSGIVSISNNEFQTTKKISEVKIGQTTNVFFQDNQSPKSKLPVPVTSTCKLSSEEKDALLQNHQELKEQLNDCHQHPETNIGPELSSTNQQDTLLLNQLSGSCDTLWSKHAMDKEAHGGEQVLHGDVTCISLCSDQGKSDTCQSLDGRTRCLEGTQIVITRNRRTVMSPDCGDLDSAHITSLDQVRLDHVGKGSLQISEDSGLNTGCLFNNQNINKKTCSLLSQIELNFISTNEEHYQNQLMQSHSDINLKSLVSKANLVESPQQGIVQPIDINLKPSDPIEPFKKQKPAATNIGNTNDSLQDLPNSTKFCIAECEKTISVECVPSSNSEMPVLDSDDKLRDFDFSTPRVLSSLNDKCSECSSVTRHPSTWEYSVSSIANSTSTDLNKYLDTTVSSSSTSNDAGGAPYSPTPTPTPRGQSQLSNMNSSPTDDQAQETVMPTYEEGKHHTQSLQVTRNLIGNCKGDFLTNPDLPGFKSHTLISPHIPVRNNISEGTSQEGILKLCDKVPKQGCCDETVVEVNLVSLGTQEPLGRDLDDASCEKQTLPDSFQTTFSCHNMVHQTTERLNEHIAGGVGSGDGVVLELTLDGLTLPDTGMTRVEELPFTPPRLIRQNSYTLESPSPMLLAHMERNNQTLSKSYENIPKSATSIELPYKRSKHKWTPKKCNFERKVINSSTKSTSPQKHNQKKNVNGMNFHQITKPSSLAAKQRIHRGDCSLPSSCVTSPVKTHSPYASTGCLSFPPNESRKSSLQHSTTKKGIQLSSNTRHPNSKFTKRVNNSHVKHSPTSNECNPTNDSKILKDVATASGCTSLSPKELVLELFLQLQADHEYQMTELIARQKREQDSMRDMLLHQRNNFLKEVDTMYPGSFPALRVCGRKESVEHPTGQEGDLVESSSVETLEPELNVRAVHDKSTCARNLFPALLAQPTPQQKAAAVVLTAAVRGFLTRRLLRTEHVQAIITTVRDTLLCAHQLHLDPEVQLRDVELHQRLIHQ